MVYKFTPRGRVYTQKYYLICVWTDYKTVQPTETVSVLPVMHTKTSDGRGDMHIDLPSFQIRVQNPARSMIEMSIEVFPQETLLPVLITFMLQYRGDKSPFQVFFYSFLAISRPFRVIVILCSVINIGDGLGMRL